jgi:hypothetical protein
MKLPHQLKQLESFDDRVVLDEATIARLPGHLTSLDLKYAIKSFPAITETLFQAFPRTLTSLKVYPTGARDADKIQTTPESSQHLPKCLETLEIGLIDLGGNENLTKWILGLPKSDLFANASGTEWLDCLRTLDELTSLRLAFHQVSRPTQCSSLHFLPRKLKSLFWIQTFDGQFNNESFRGAPPSLTYLNIPSSPSLNEDCLQFLPNLEEVEFPTGTLPAWLRKASPTELRKTLSKYY